MSNPDTPIKKVPVKDTELPERTGVLPVMSKKSTRGGPAVKLNTAARVLAGLIATTKGVESTATLAVPVTARAKEFNFDTLPPSALVTSRFCAPEGITARTRKPKVNSAVLRTIASSKMNTIIAA